MGLLQTIIQVWDVLPDFSLNHPAIDPASGVAAKFPETFIWGFPEIGIPPVIILILDWDFQ